MNQLLPELYPLIILSADQSDRWKVYAGLIAIPQFARTLTLGRILDWMETCGVDVRIVSTVFSCSIRWFINKQIHRNGDKPAIEFEDGGKEWYQYDKLHRERDKPAAIYEDGSLYWCQNGKCHREYDKPACIDEDGCLYWYVEGKLHRDNNKPAIINLDGSIEYWIHGVKV